MRPIYKYLTNRKEIIDFKMPGHKKRVSFNDIGKIDETETYGTDNLHWPKSIIKEAQDYASQVFGTKKSLYIVNGSTSALQIAILASTRPGDKIIMQRNSHMAIYNSLILGRLEADYLYPKISDGIASHIEVDHFKRVVESSDAGLIVLTNPSYEGYSSDLGLLISIAKAANKIVIVDEAHGAHLKFTSRLVESGLDLGADIVVHSAHKTLPSMTQTSLLHINSNRVNIARIEEFSRIIQTSSPSYVLMASLEKSIDYMDGQGRAKLDELIDICEEFQGDLRSIRGIQVPNPPCHRRDISKIHFSLAGYSGSSLGRKLYDDYGINMEYGDYSYVLGIGSVMNEKRDFKILLGALKDLGGHNGNSKDHVNISLDKAVIKEPIYRAFYKKKKCLGLEDSLGKISGTFIIPYPPGTVILAPGELIKDSHIRLIKLYRDNNIELINNDRLEVIDE